MVAHVVPVEPFDLVVFGATGDLARRKLIPGHCHVNWLVSTDGVGQPTRRPWRGRHRESSK